MPKVTLTAKQFAALEVWMQQSIQFAVLSATRGPDFDSDDEHLIAMNAARTVARHLLCSEADTPPSDDTERG